MSAKLTGATEIRNHLAEKHQPKLLAVEKEKGKTVEISAVEKSVERLAETIVNVKGPVEPEKLAHLESMLMDQIQLLRNLPTQ